MFHVPLAGGVAAVLEMWAVKLQSSVLPEDDSMIHLSAEQHVPHQYRMELSLLQLSLPLTWSARGSQQPLKSGIRLPDTARWGVAARARPVRQPRMSATMMPSRRVDPAAWEEGERLPAGIDTSGPAGVPGLSRVPEIRSEAGSDRPV